MSDRAAPERVLIYRDHLLRFSERWVRVQGESLRGFRPYYAGSKRFADVDMPPERTFVVNRGGPAGAATELLFKATGWSPGLFRWASRLRPALLHAHFGMDGALLLRLARHLRLPLVTSFHGYDVMTKDAYAARSFFLQRRYLRRRARLARDGTLFIAVSQYLRGLLLEQGFPASRTIVHYIGVDTPFFTADPSVAREKIIVFVSRLWSEKGCDYLIKAMADVHAVHPDAELVIIGDGPERAALEALARQSARPARFLGVLPHEDIRRWLNRARVFCVPSLRIECGHGEAFGLVFAEAQAMGVPVVSFASGGLPEVIAHGATGFLAEERDWRALAGHIINLLDDDGLWQSMSEAGRERTRRLYDLATQTRALEGLYCDLLRERRMPDATPAETLART